MFGLSPADDELDLGAAKCRPSTTHHIYIRRSTCDKYMSLNVRAFVPAAASERGARVSCHRVPANVGQMLCVCVFNDVLMFSEKGARSA